MNEVEMKKERIEKEIAEKAAEYGMTCEELCEVSMSCLYGSTTNGRKHVPSAKIRKEVLEVLKDKGLVISIYDCNENLGTFSFYIDEAFSNAIREITYSMVRYFI